MDPAWAARVRQRHHVQEHGVGPTLLYAHGFGCNQAVWERVLPAFSATHSQVTFDYAGAGRADPMAFDPQRHATLDGYVDDLLAIARAVAPEEGLTLVAHSVSCSIGMLAAARAPALFSDIVMIGPNPCFVNHPPHYVGGFARRDFDGLMAQMDRDFLGWSRTLAPLAAGPDGGTALSQRLLDSFCANDPVMARTFAAASFHADVRAVVPKVRTPALVLQHREDAFAPQATGRWLAEHLPHGRYALLDVAGHCAHMSHPELVADAMRHWLARGQTASTPSASTRS